MKFPLAKTNNMQLILRSTLFIFLLTLPFTGLLAADIPPRPEPPRLVNDFSNTLNSSQVRQLEQKLVRYNDTTSTQIVVVLISDLGMRPVADFAYAIGEKWGVGQKGQNNGAVILVKPKAAGSRGQAFIATGYGLEGAIPDALAKRIVEQEMIPSFKQDDYYGGIDQAINTMMALASGEYTADDYTQPEIPAAWFIPIFVLLIAFFMIFLTRSSNHIGGKKSNLPLWTALFLASQMSSRHSGSFKGFSGGSGFGGGGGFGGFGGGSFGGGGAGGSW
jgi:uncharacterized protein